MSRDTGIAKDLAQISLFVVDLAPTDAWRSSERADLLAVAERHLDWLMEQESIGVLALSGPLDFTPLEPGEEIVEALDPSRWDGSGMMVIRAPSREDAFAVVEREPFHAAGLRLNTVRSWTVNEGHLVLSVDLFAGRGTLC